ncbi:MAG: 1-acyl-sn-glycerol-3-phosphate acyltransferase [Oscillospiraceae bacterium]|nr:1-acyl-sn-glycerol-3-phosphate acyltransferase [Oscillospiraceae bacterium]
MKINTKNLSYEQVLKLPRLQHKTPLKPSRLLAAVVRIVCAPTLWKTKFSYTTERMELAKDQPCLILMNHSSFTDMKLAFGIFYPQRLGIVTSVDAMTGFLGKLMRLLGCTPTHKYVADMSLIKDISHMLKKNKTSVLMYPEAGYSFDGCATAMPERLGVLVKRLGVPVVTVITQGAFHRDPLYNMLQIRDVKVSAHVKCIASAAETKEKSVEELDALITEAFSFDNFAWQRDNKISIDVPFRADGLHRILYKCPHCGAENHMEGKGITLTCHSCGKQWTMDCYGQLCASEGDTEYPHIPDWYRWQRECVRKEIEEGTYLLDTDVDIVVQVNLDAVYKIGKGHLVHNENGFRLTGGDGLLDYSQSPAFSHTLYSDYYWYEMGDVIGIGNNEFSYFCLPGENVSVTKARLATEELYKLKKKRKRALKKAADQSVEQ